jgi:DNA-binding CsgD family transcriptional regulator
MDALPLLEALYRRPGLTNADRAHVAGSLAVSLAFCGDVERARTVLRDALDLAAGADDETQARTFGRASTVAFFAADEALLEEYAHAAVRIAERRSLYALAARIYTTLSAQSTAAGDLRSAAAFAHKVAQNAEKGGDPALFARGIREMMALEADMGNASQVAALEARLAGTSYRGPMGMSAYRLAKAMVAIWAGDFGAALGMLRVGEDTPALYQQRLLTSLAAVCAAALGRVPACEALLESYAVLEADDAEEQPMFARSRGLSVRYAILATALAGRTLAARRRLRKLQTSERFRHLDAALDALTARNRPSFERAVGALEDGDEGGIARVLTVSAARASLIGDALANLTDTERAVLRALIDGHSNKAIADLQGRAVNTVRSQVSSILKKLDCRSRGEAVALARRRGLV